MTMDRAVRPQLCATAAAASALDTWCSPTSASSTSAGSAPGTCSVKRGRPEAAVTTPSADTTGASDPSTLVRPEAENQRTSTPSPSTSAIARTRGSSAFSTATPPGRSDSTSSAFARAVFSIEPKTPECAVPTMSSTATSGVTSDVR